ncbi:MAG: hypothetical protein Q7R40_09930 [Phaeospirillum sp.]|nr:hypothetical protein [Phaeospirillum sp.]
MNHTVLALLIAAGLGVSAIGGAFAADHGHASHGAAQSEPTLDHGRQWPTDGALRHGMSEIRDLMADAAPRIHDGRFDAAEFSRLANGISARIEYVTANCKLPPEADAQLHLVLARIMDGVEHMKTERKAQDGVVMVIDAISSYGRFFAHPGWQSPSH